MRGDSAVCQPGVPFPTGGEQLAGHPGYPRLMLLLFRPQTVLINMLDRFFTGGEDHPQQVQVVGQRLGMSGKQPTPVGVGRFEIMEDQRGVHQLRPVIKNHRRRLDHRINTGEFVKAAKDR